MQHYVFNLIITHSNSKVQCECWQLGNTKTRLVLFQLCPLSSFTNLTGRHSKGFSLCHEESIAFNQTSPILGIGYQRLTAEITVSRLSGTWLHLLTSDQGPTPAALCVHIRLCHPHPPHTSLNDYGRTLQASGISSDWLLPHSAVWSDALVSELRRILAGRSKGAVRRDVYQHSAKKKHVDHRGPKRTTAEEDMWITRKILAHSSG